MPISEASLANARRNAPASGSFGAHFVWELAFTDQVSADLELPKWIVYACIPLGSYLMCYRFLQVCWSFIACALFAAVSGSSPATVVAIGSILLPAMVSRATRTSSASVSSGLRARSAS